MSALLLLARLFSASVRGQMQYPGSAIALGVAQFFTTIIDILAAWALFDRFGPVQGWTFGDVALYLRDGQRLLRHSRLPQPRL